MIPFVFLLSCSDSPVVDDSERQDSDPPPASCSEELEGQASLCIQIDGSETTPMKPHFSGFNVQNFRDGWQPWDERLVEASLAVIPGTVRFPGGASSYVYHWKTGSTPAAYVDAFTLKDRSKVRFDDYRSNSAGKGYVKLHD